MIKFYLIWIAIFSYSVQGASLYTASTDVPKPVQIVESQTKILMDELSNRKDEFDQDPQALIYFARNVALSHWDIQKASRLMLGKYWKKADASQREQFEEEFLRTLLRYVVKAYGYYDDSLVEIVSYDWQAKGKTGKGGWVRSKIRLPAGLKVSVDYRMNLNKQAHWKLVDVRVEGISLVSTKRTEYRGIIREKGIEALIKAMKEKNQKVLST